jgi:SMI1/KNR4 family protein SUKH-1
MTVDAAITRLRRAAEPFEEWERPRFADRSPLFAINRTEQLLGHALPEDVRHFFGGCDEVIAMDVHNGYRLGGTDWLGRALQEETFPRYVQTDGGPNRVIPFATDGGGNAFLVGVGHDGVWRWDHETGHTEAVAGTFGEFLCRVADDWEHFAAGDHDWRYLT